jgi:hypothetical protein
MTSPHLSPCTSLRSAFIFFVSTLLSGHVLANSNFTADSEETISGSIYIETNNNGRRDRFEEGIAGVSVSNGCDVVQSDSGGNYQIPIHATQVLFISKPAALLFNEHQEF